MIVDGKKIAEAIYARIKARVAALHRAPVLAIITCAPNFETQKYLALKQKKATEVGIEVKVIEMKPDDTTDTFIAQIHAEVPRCDGLIVQLPLPPHIDTEAVLQAIPTTHDVDALNTQTTAVHSPVVGAIEVILLHHEVPVIGAFVTIVGSGRLVGKPAYAWFTERGAHVSLVTKDTEHISNYTKTADIIVCGAGVPGLLKPDMIQGGACVLDAGVSEVGGELRGDADPLCAEKAGLLTPVPGGVGPITIAILLKNVVDLATESADML